jgi:hypothetical protein
MIAGMVHPEPVITMTMVEALMVVGLIEVRGQKVKVH